MNYFTKSLSLSLSLTRVNGQRQITHCELDIWKIGIHLWRRVVAFAVRHHQLIPVKMLGSKLGLCASHVAVARGTCLGDNELNVGVIVNHNCRRRVLEHIQIVHIVLLDECDHQGNGFGAILYTEAATRKWHCQWNGYRYVKTATNGNGHKVHKGSVASVFPFRGVQIVEQFYGVAQAEEMRGILSYNI